jgi:VCBS repeat-containing protein
LSTFFGLQEERVTAVANVTPTGNVYIDGVLTGVKWAVNTLTYSFPTDPTFYGTNYGSGENTSGFVAFTPIQQAAVRSILAEYASVINFTFTETTETTTQHAELRYAESSLPSTAWAYLPSTAATGGDAWFGSTNHWYDSPVVGNYAWLTLMHETGHTMGLKHPQTASGSFGVMPLDHDSLEYTVMSYRSYIGASTTTGLTNETYGFPQTLMMYDVAGLQEMYGANYTTNSGDTVYKWDSATGQEFINGIGQAAPGADRIFMNIWDGGGHDTYDFSNYTTNLNVNLAPGGWTVTSNAQLAYLGGGHYAVGNISNSLLYHGNTASLIDDAIGGSGNDIITGNIADNGLRGGAGNDTLDGASGTDTAIYSGLAADYQWLQNANGTWTVADLRAGTPDGIDTLGNIEFLKFLDTTVQIGTAPVVPTNHAPAITSGTQSASLTEWADLSANETANTPHTAAGLITYTDSDATDLHTASVAAEGTGYLGTFSLNTSNIDSDDSVGWSFSVSDKAIDYLTAGQTLTQSYDVTLDDGHGGTAMQMVTITIIGASDATTKVAHGGKGGKGAAPSNGPDNADLSDHNGNGAPGADNHSIVQDQAPAQSLSDTLVFKSFPPSQQNSAQFDSTGAGIDQTSVVASAFFHAAATELSVHGIMDEAHHYDWLLT